MTGGSRHDPLSSLLLGTLDWFHTLWSHTHTHSITELYIYIMQANMKHLEAIGERKAKPVEAFCLLGAQAVSNILFVGLTMIEICNA